MMSDGQEPALIVGAGSGLSAALARKLAAQGRKVALAARDTAKLAALCAETGATAFACDATSASDVTQLFEQAAAKMGPFGVVIYNASFRTRGNLVDLEPAGVQATLMVSAYGGFLVGQQAARMMLPRRQGAILFTGASASVKGYAQSAPFAMGSSPCAAWRKAWRASWRRRASMSRIS